MWASANQLVVVELVQRSAGVVVLAVQGEIDYSNSAALHDRLRELLEPDTSRLVLDFSDVTFCDSSGMSTLITLWQHLHGRGGQCAVAAAPAAITRALRISGVQNLIATYPTVEDARRAAQ